MTMYKFLRCIHLTRWQNEKSRYVGEVLDCFRREDSRDFGRSELNELVGNLTCPDACEGKVWKSVWKIVTDEKINPKILMDEKSLKTRKE